MLQYWAQLVWGAVWARLDSNHDGTVDRAEFMRLDRNGDGDVDGEELMKFMHDELGFAMVSGETSFASFVLRAGGDHDQDGNLTWDEFKKAAALAADGKDYHDEHEAMETKEF